MRCADKGAEIVRITVQGMSEAKACAEIKDKLISKGYVTPLVADIHFAPKVALAVADCFDKIRINPGNFADGRKKFETINYEDEKEYQAELDYIEEVCGTPCIPFLRPAVCPPEAAGWTQRASISHGCDAERPGSSSRVRLLRCSPLSSRSARSSTVPSASARTTAVCRPGESLCSQSAHPPPPPRRQQSLTSCSHRPATWW